MVELNLSSSLTIVDKSIEERPGDDRPYLGMSEIGHKCWRYLWIKYHTNFKQQFPAQLLRIFEMGNMIEKRMIMEFKLAGFEISSQQRCFSDFDHKYKGHCDCIISGLMESKRPHILEVKSCSNENYKKFTNKGIQGHPIYGEKYYSQVQMYMHYSGLKNALIVVENKNNSAQYSERIKYDSEDCKHIRDKANQIIISNVPMKGISNRVTWYECKSCPFNNDDYCRKLWPGESPF